MAVVVGVAVAACNDGCGSCCGCGKVILRSCRVLSPTGATAWNTCAVWVGGGRVGVLFI